MSLPTDKEMDRLALEGCDILDYGPGTHLPYDVACYDRLPRRETPPGGFVTREASRLKAPPLPAQARLANEAYTVRISGFRREHLFGPDEIGELVARHGIAWNDGLGNGLLESLLIDRKYGFSHSLEAPRMGFSLPFFEKEWEAFREDYPRRVGRMVERLKELESIYGGRIVGRERELCVLCPQESPLFMFSRACAQDPKAATEELLHAIGSDTAPLNPATPRDRALLAKFWTFVRGKHARVLMFQSEVLRKVLGRGARIIGNAHEFPNVDLDALGQAFDAVGISARPMLLTDDVHLRHYVAYHTQLVNDLSGKPPMVGVRVNMLAAGCRIIASANLIRLWYDQAVRHGAGGFYFWTRDYPSDMAHNPYDGPMPGNPDASTLPEMRWETSLEMLGKLTKRRRLCLPGACVAILVPTEAALLHRREWRRIYAAFAACAEARIHTHFLSDRAVLCRSIPAGVRAIVAPVLEFVSPGLREALEGFVKAGGVLLLSDKHCWDTEGKLARPLQGGVEVGPELFDIFPLGEAASLDALLRSANTIRKEIEVRGIEPRSWLFDVSCENLLLAEGTEVGAGDSSITFDHWLYEHASDWMLPYVKKAVPSERKVEQSADDCEA